MLKIKERTKEVTMLQSRSRNRYFYGAKGTKDLEHNNYLESGFNF
jgi:hypothetical protein